MPMRSADVERVRALPLFKSASPRTFDTLIAGGFLPMPT